MYTFLQAYFYIIIKMQDKQKKQVFLRENILEKGYNAEDFVTYLNTKLPIGDNLDLCSFDELKAVVNQYISLKKQEEDKPNFQPLIPMTEMIQIQQPKNKQPKKYVVFKNYNPNILEPEFSKVFQCKKLVDKFDHVKKIITCSVSNPERKTTGGVFGLGTTSFLEFKVQTPELGWKVGRRYSDFMWLRAYLLKKYPSYIIPPVPEKKASKKTQRHIEKRMRILEYFLNDLISKPQLLNDHFVEGFLSMSDSIKFQNLKKQEQKMKDWEGMTDYTSFDGEVVSQLNEENKVFFDQCQKNVEKTQYLYKQITRGGKTLQNLYTQEVNTMYEMGNLFAELHQLTRQTLNKLPKCEPIQTMNDVYITLNNMMIEWGNLIRNQHNFMEKNFNTFFKYVRNELYGFTELMQKYQQRESDYVKQRLALEKKKQKIFNLHDPQKWDLSAKQLSNLPKQIGYEKAKAFQVMLPKETATLDKQRAKTFFFMSELYSNGVQNIKHNTFRFCDNFKEFAIKLKVNTQQMGEMWMEMSSSFSGSNKKYQQVKAKPKQQDQENEVYDD